MCVSPVQRGVWDAVLTCPAGLAQAYKNIPVGVPVAAHALHTCVLGSSSTGLPGKKVGSPRPILHLTGKAARGHSVALVGHNAGTGRLMPPLATVLCSFSCEAWLPPPPVDAVQAAKPTDCR